MDARVTVPPRSKQRTVEAYVARAAGAGAFDDGAFAEAYAIMAAQRNSKILGIFVRLDRRDGKPAYLKHLPRIRAYLRRALAHPALARRCATSTSARLSSRSARYDAAGRPRPPWCSPPGSASGCGRSPTRCRSRWCRSPARPCSTGASTRLPRPASRRRSSTSTISPTDRAPCRAAQRAADRHLRRKRRNCSIRPAASSRRCRNSAASLLSSSTPIRSGSTAAGSNLERLALAWDAGADGYSAHARRSRLSYRP